MKAKNCLKLTLNYPADAMLTKLAQKLKIQPHTVWNELYTNAVADSYKKTAVSLAGAGTA